ncbi:MAG: Uncharacterised protein [Formosa sp. Hel1_33_131]|nr:MAG: Uncharacterised protein [Formosa sp. Hel1_33_131]|tara:strand:- start:7000 stop:7653 length:654 start_codon:yes stop_codon:yes gene_type:complete
MLRDVLFNDWYTIIIVVSLALIVSAKLLDINRFSDFLKLIGNSNYLRIYFKDHKFLDPFDILLFLNFCINAVLIGILTYSIFVDNTELNWQLFLRFLLIFIGSVLLKILVELGLGSLFDIKKLFHSYVFQQVSFLNFLGVILVPLNSLLIFGVPNNRTVLVGILIISGLILFVGFVRSIKFYQKQLINNFFYFILYLCTLEFGPYILICKLFSYEIN